MAVGMGHFMRCFAIGEEARARGIDVTFLVNRAYDFQQQRCDAIGATLRTADALGSDAAQLDAMLAPDDWLLVDSYEATSEYLAALHRFARVAVIDDLNTFDRFDCDIVINAAMSASRDAYTSKSTARLLLGAKYALIRREFLTRTITKNPERSVVVMFGGSDPTGLSSQVAERLLEALPDVSISVVLGPAGTQSWPLSKLFSRPRRLKIYSAPAKVSKVLRNAGLVVTAAGGSVGEVAAMRLPALVLVAYDNQAAALQACPYPIIDVRQGLPDDLEAQVKALFDDTARRKAIAAAAHKIVDGKGAKRIVEAMFGA